MVLGPKALINVGCWAILRVTVRYDIRKGADIILLQGPDPKKL